MFEMDGDQPPWPRLVAYQVEGLRQMARRDPLWIRIVRALRRLST